MLLCSKTLRHILFLFLVIFACFKNSAMASGNGKCQTIFDSMALKEKFRDAYNYLLGLPIKSRLKVFASKAKIVSKFQGRETVVQEFIDELNFAVRKGVMTEAQATKIIRDSKIDIIKKHFTTNGKVEFRLTENDYIKVRLDSIRQKLMTSKRASADKIDAALSNGHFLNFKQDSATFEKMFFDIEDTFDSALKKLPSGTVDDLLDYLIFLGHQHERDFALGLRQFPSFLKSPDDYGSLVKKFIKLQESTVKFGKEEELRLTKILLKRGKSKNVARKVAKRMAQRNVKQYENRLFSCNSRRPGPERRTAGKNFTKFAIGLGITSTIGVYSYRNWDKEKDNKWLGVLGLDIVTAAILSFVRSKLLASGSPLAEKVTGSIFGLGFLGTVGSTYAVDGTLKYGFSKVYGSLLGMSDEEADAKLKEYFKDPKRVESLEKLYLVLEKYNMHEHYINAIPKVSEAFANGEIGEDFFDDQEVKEFLIKGLIQSEYDENKGFLSTGSHDSDLYLFDRIWFVPMTMRSVAVNLFIYKVLCVNGEKPINAFMKASAIAVAEQAIFTPLYYKAREWATGI